MSSTMRSRVDKSATVRARLLRDRLDLIVKICVVLLHSAMQSGVSSNRGRVRVQAVWVSGVVHETLTRPEAAQQVCIHGEAIGASV